MLYPAELKIKKCPFGCDADMELIKETMSFKTKGEDIVADRWVYKCPICSNGFTTTHSDTITMENIKHLKKTTCDKCGILYEYDWHVEYDTCPKCGNDSSTSPFDEFMIGVREQLNCNAESSFKQQYITYGYTNEQVDENLEYFERCMKFGLSPYKSLLFFGDYLKGEYEI